MKKLVFLLMIALLALVACEPDPTPPPEDGPILVGVNDMPKQVVTIWISPTPQGGIPTPTQVIVSPTESETPEPPEPTATPTAGVGVFLGESRDGTPVANAVPPVAIPPSSGVAGGGGLGPGTGGVPGGVPGTGGTGGIPGGQGSIDPGAIAPPVFLPPNSGLHRPVLPYCYDRVNPAFINVYRQYEALARYLGCARADGTYTVNIVTQSFERGQMIWRADNRDIYALPTAGNYIRVLDTWSEGMPDSDPTLSPPIGLSQPVRGFGLAWRNNPTIRDSVGWAMTSEIPMASQFQEFWFGFMFVADNNRVYAVIPDLRNPDTGTVYGPFSQ